MKSPLRSWSRLAPGIAAAFLLLGLAPQTVRAQCPIAAVCTPGPASNPQAAAFGLAILNVTVGNNLINRTSPGYTAGYHDFSCTLNANLVVGQTYPISVRTTAVAVQNVRVYIDYNNDGAFTGNSELVFEDINPPGSLPTNPHTGTFTPQAPVAGGPPLGTRLRLRVVTDYVNSPVPTSCSTPEYSQDEDYSVKLVTNVSPPMAAFTTSGTTTCTGCVQFTDASQNLPTGWLWNFGDGYTGPQQTQQNPNHCYTTAGTYAVTLQATNAAGNNTTAATSIVYNTTVPLAASCTPATTGYFGNYGIVRFRLNTIDNTSADGSAGYQDFTCPRRTELTAGVNYPMIITTGGTNAHDIRVYLDKNNDGIFQTTDLVYQNVNTPSPGVTIPFSLTTGVTLNVPLRLRVIADAVGSPAGACANQTAGQAEDYTVIARPNTAPPVASFTSNYVPGGCANTITFTDQSTNLPTAWFWNFGDGYTGPQQTQQNPTHTYTTTGSYNVSLTVTNANGTATITRVNAVMVQVPCLNYCPSNGTGGPGPGGPQPSPFYITSVAVSNAQPAYNNATGNAAGGYGNYSNLPINVRAGSNVNLTVVTNLAAGHLVSVWVDWNRNGIFDINPTELVIPGFTPPGPNSATFSGSFAVPTGFTVGLNTRMRVQVVVNNQPPNACGVNIVNAEVEDYQLVSAPLATREALALPSLSLFPNPTLDGQLRLRLPDAQAAGLYATEVQNLLGTTVLRTELRLGPAADAGLNLSALAPGVYVLRLRDAQGQVALRRVVRQ